MRAGESRITRHARSGVFLTYGRKARVLCSILLKYLPGAVSRTVIYADDLDFLQGLRTDRIQAFPKIGSDVVNGKDHSDLRPELRKEPLHGSMNGIHDLGPPGADHRGNLFSSGPEIVRLRLERCDVTLFRPQDRCALPIEPCQFDILAVPAEDQLRNAGRECRDTGVIATRYHGRTACDRHLQGQRRRGPCVKGLDARADFGGQPRNDLFCHRRVRASLVPKLIGKQDDSALQVTHGVFDERTHRRHIALPGGLPLNLGLVAEREPK